MSGDPRAVLEHWVASPTTPQRVVRRSRIVILALDGLPFSRIATQLGVSARTVHLWVFRFKTGGAAALFKDAPGRGRHASLDAATVRQQLAAAGLLKDDGMPKSLRKAAALVGGSPTAVWRALHKDAAR